MSMRYRFLCIVPTLLLIFVLLCSEPSIASEYTTHNSSTNSATGITTFTQTSWTNNISGETTGTNLIPISRKSHVQAIVSAENETGCNTSAGFKNGSSYLAYASRTSGTGVTNDSWSGTVYSTSNYYAYTYAHKGLLGSSKATVTVTISPYFNLAYIKSSGEGEVKVYKGTTAVSTLAENDTVEILAGESVKLVATPAAGFRFVRWEGAVAGTSTTSPTFTMNGDKTVTAVFADNTISNVTYPSDAITNSGRDIIIKWNAVFDYSGIQKYQVGVTTSSTTYPTSYSDVSATVNTKTYVGLSSKDTFYAWVRAIDKVGNTSSWTRTNAFSPTAQQASIVSVSPSIVSGQPPFQVDVAVTDVDAAYYVIERKPSTSVAWAVYNFTYSEMDAKNFVYSETSSLESHATYDYRVYTKNDLNASTAKSSVVQATIPNIPASYVVTGPVNDSMTKEFTHSFSLSPTTDLEGDTLTFTVLYKLETGTENSSDMSESGSISETFPGEGTWTWRYEVVETGINNFIKKTNTPDQTLNIDHTEPVGTMTVSNKDKTKIYTESNPTNTSEVYINYINVQDINGTFKSGINKIYFFNGSTKPSKMYLLASALTSSGELIQTVASEVASGLAGIEVPVSYTPANGQLPFMLPASDGSKTVTMMMEDVVGNQGTYKVLVKRDTAKPHAPTGFTHTPTQYQADITPSILTFSWQVNDAEVIRYEVDYIINNVTNSIEEEDIKLQRIKTTLIGTADIPLGSTGPNQVVQIIVRSVDQAGNLSQDSSNLAYTKASLGDEIVSSGYNDSTGQYYMNWNLTTIGVAASRQVEYGTKEDDVFTPIGLLSFGSGVEVSTTSLTQHQEVHYRLLASNSSNDQTIGVLTSATVANTLPTAPQLEAPKVWSHQKDVTFNYRNGSDPDGDLLTHYIYFKEKTEADFTEFAKVDSGQTVPEKTGLLEGITYVWYVQARDQYDGARDSAVAEFTVDSIQPILSVQEPHKVYSTEEFITIVVSESGSGLSGNKVSYTKTYSDPGKGTLSGEVTMTSDINGTYMGTFALEEGSYDLAFTAKDNASNTTTQNVPGVKVDRTNPTLNSVSIGLATNSTGTEYVTSIRNIPVTISASDSGSGINGARYWFVKDQFTPLLPEESAFWNGSLAEPIQVLFPNVNSERYLLALQVEDKAGNVSPIVYTNQIFMDNTSPIISNVTLGGLTNVGEKYYLGNLNNLTIDVTSSDQESTVVSTEYGIFIASSGSQVGAWGTLESIKELTLTTGVSYQVGVKVTNGVYSTSSYTSQVVFVCDYTDPIQTLAVPSHEVISRETVSFIGTAQDDQSDILGRWLAIGTTSGGTEVSQMIAGNDQGWLEWQADSDLLRVSLPDMNNGTYYVSYKVSNGAGLVVTSAQYNLTVNNIQDKVIVETTELYTTSTTELIGSWEYKGTKPVIGYQYRIIGTAGVILPWQTTTEKAVLVSGLLLEHGEAYKFEVRAVHQPGIYSETATGAEIMVDTTLPIITELTVPGFSALEGIRSITWAGGDLESGIAKVEVALGNSIGETDVTHGWVRLSGCELLKDTAGATLNLIDGQHYYLTLRLTNGAGRQVEKTAAAIIIDDTAPPAPKVTDQGMFINTEQPMEINWAFTAGDPESGTIKYEWTVYTLEDSTQVQWHDCGSAVKASTASIDGFIAEDKTTYKFAVRATNGAGLTSIGYSDGIYVDATKPDLPKLTLVNGYREDDPAAAVEVFYISKLDDLYLLIESEDLDSGLAVFHYAYGPEETVTDLPRQSSSDSRIKLENPLIPLREKIVFAGEAVNGSDLVSLTGFSAGIIYDTARPEIIGLKGQLVGEQIVFDWDVNPTTVPIIGYEVAVVSDGLAIPDSAWINVGLNKSVSINITDLLEGYYRFYVRGRNAAGQYSSQEVVSERIQIDYTAPTITEIKHSLFTDDVLRVQVKAFDATSGIQKYQYALGTILDPTAYSTDWMEIQSNEGLIEWSINTQGTPDQTDIYLRVKVQDYLGIWSEPRTSMPIRVDHTKPTTPTVTGPAYVTSLSEISGIAFNGSEDAESNVTYYKLGVSSTSGDPWLKESDVRPITETNGLLTGLTGILADGGTFYIAVKTQNGAGTWSDAGYSAPVVIDVTAPELIFTNADAELVFNVFDGEKTVNFTLNEPAVITGTLTAADGTAKLVTMNGTEGVNIYYFEETVPQRYTLSLTAQDMAGHMHQDQAQEIRLNASPVISLPGEITAVPGESITITANVTDDTGNPVLYEWYPGEGLPMVTSTEPVSPILKYPEAKDYILTLKVIDKDNGFSEKQMAVKIHNTMNGTLKADETWTGTHNVTGDITVPEGITLTILPETTVIMLPDVGQITADYQILVQGSLIGESATITTELTIPGSWKGIKVEGHVDLTNITIQYAYRGLVFIGNTPISTISGCILQNNKVGVHSYSAAPVILNSLFLNNALYGIKEDLVSVDQELRPVVTDCTFSNNGMDYYHAIDGRYTIEQLNEIAGNYGNIIQ